MIFSYKVTKEDSKINFFAHLKHFYLILILIFIVSVFMFLFLLFVYLFSDKSAKNAMFVSLDISSALLIFFSVNFLARITERNKMFKEHPILEFQIVRKKDVVTIKNITRKSSISFSKKEISLIRFYKEVIIFKVNNLGTLSLPNCPEIKQILTADTFDDIDDESKKSEKGQ